MDIHLFGHHFTIELFDECKTSKYGVHFIHNLHSISSPITWTVSLNLGDPFIYNILLCAVYIIILLVCVCV